MISFDDLRNAPHRKPSSKRSRQDAANIKEAWENRWKQMSEETKTSEKEVETFREEGVDWGLDFDK